VGTASWQSFVAMGDSFTEGLEDLRADGSYRGWADLVASELAANSKKPAEFRYANLAVRGRKMPEIADEQVPVAVQMQPDLVSLVGGVNDLMRPTYDLEQISRVLNESVGALRAAGTDVILLVGANPGSRSPKMAALVSHRLHALNETVATIAADHDCLTVDFTGIDLFEDSRMWSEDRLHLSSLGHERISGAYLAALGLGDDSWLEPLPPADEQGVVHRMAKDAQWAGQYLAPWLARRVTGRSSGDGLEAKRPQLLPVEREALRTS
jgi:lysophospholipase L1-like esterase